MYNSVKILALPPLWLIKVRDHFRLRAAVHVSIRAAEHRIPCSWTHDPEAAFRHFFDLGLQPGALLFSDFLEAGCEDMNIEVA